MDRSVRQARSGPLGAGSFPGHLQAAGSGGAAWHGTGGSGQFFRRFTVISGAGCRHSWRKSHRRRAIAALRLPPSRDEQGHWLISADGHSPPPNESFLDHEKIAVRLFTPESDDAKVFLLDQTGPGHYEVHTKLSGPISAIFFHPTAAPLSPPQGRPAPASAPPIGQLQTAAVESTEWPASVARPLQLSDLPGTEDLSAGTSGAWSPPLRQSFALTPWFWLIAVAAALAALVSRRYQTI